MCIYDVAIVPKMHKLLHLPFRTTHMNNIPAALPQTMRNSIIVAIFVGGAALQGM
jgi:hypothetical protein